MFVSKSPSLDQTVTKRGIEAAPQMLTTTTHPSPPTATTQTKTNVLSGHCLKRLIKENYEYLNPVSVKTTKSRGGWNVSWAIVIETSKVFITIQDKKDMDLEIRNWILNTIKHAFEDGYRFDTNITVDWPLTVEDVKNLEQEELKKRQEEEEKKELENKKRKRLEEEYEELDKNVRPKIMKKDMGTMEEFKKNMRNEEFDEQVRALWRTELNRKADVIMSYPFKELETMRNERSEIEKYISGIVPHVSSGDYREPFFGNMDRVFPQARYNISRMASGVQDYKTSFTYDTFESCIRLYHKVHRDPEGCSVEALRLYSYVFVVE